jgi:hypothetical protein
VTFETFRKQRFGKHFKENIQANIEIDIIVPVTDIKAYGGVTVRFHSFWKG